MLHKVSQILNSSFISKIAFYGRHRSEKEKQACWVTVYKTPFALFLPLYNTPKRAQHGSSCLSSNFK